MILISQESSEIRVAVLEKNRLEELYFERADQAKICGNVYKGVVKAIVPGIAAAFVTLKNAKDGFLYLEEETLVEIDEAPLNVFGFSLFGKDKKQTSGDDKIHEGQEIVVQVIKEPIRSKGPRLTRRISIPARYVVLMPGKKELGISRRIEDPQERKRIKKIFNDIKLPNDAGFIVRTAGEGKSQKEYERDIKYLLKKWKQIHTDIRRMKSPALIHQELDLVERVIRDHLTDDTQKIIVDRKELEKKVLKFIKLYMPNYKGKIIYEKSKASLFERYKIENEIERTFRRKVNLACGGHIVIEQTEGLVAIDVNSGRFTGDRNQKVEETAFRTNCEAAREIARQIRLRDIGGIIIIDFIDMDRADHRRKVFQTLDVAVQPDRAKTNILQISKLGLVEMTRQRMRPSLESAIYDTCPYCEGRGVVRSVVTMSLKAIRDIKKTLQGTSSKNINITIHPDVADRLRKQERASLKSIEKDHKSRIHLHANDTYHIEDLTISLG